MANKSQPRIRLTNIATRHQVLLERLKTREALDFSAIFEEMDKVTRAAVALTGVQRMGELTRKDLSLLLGSIKEGNQEVTNRATQQLFGKVDEFAAYESNFEGRTFKELGVDGFIVPSEKTIMAKVNSQPMTATGQLLEPFVEDWADNEVERYNLMVQRAWGESWTLQDLTKAIRGTKANGYKDGLVETTRRNAQTVARTGWQHVANTARKSTWENNDDIVVGYEWVSTLDGKTSQICRSLDGQIFKLGEGPTPPAHPNCRSTTVAKVDPSLGLDFLDEGATRSSLDGAIDAGTTYYDWLKGQDSDFIKEAIGKSRAQLFIKGGLTSDEFARLNLGRNFEPMTLAEMKTKEPLAFRRAGLN